MDPDLENVIRQALGDAQAAGRDHLSQTELAVRAVQRARPDMTAADALAAVNLARQSQPTLPMVGIELKGNVLRPLLGLDHTLAVARARVSGSNAGMD